MEKEIVYKDFDLPTKHLVSERHFVPAKARDEAEIERRRQLPTGALLAEHQERGMAVAAGILRHVRDERDVDFASRVLAASGLNTAWYSFARGAEYEVMRRRLKLPFLVAHQLEFRPSSAELLDDAAFTFSEGRRAAEKVLTFVGIDLRKEARYKREFGRAAGKASLTLACVQLGDQFQQYPLGSVDTQMVVRERCLRALDDARTLDDSIGLPPSIAQLADPDSHLSVFWRRESPNGALKAYEAAIDLAQVA